jgi:pyridoxal phosphate enzyme (YggS family)
LTKSPFQSLILGYVVVADGRKIFLEGMTVADNLARIQKTIGGAPVKLVVASKYASSELIETAFRFGVTEFGENKIQDALRKRSEMDQSIEQRINWHFIGHLQSNKARQAVGNFKLIHSIDSISLCEEVSRLAAEKGTLQPILLQVKMMPDDTKFGFSPMELKEQFAHLCSLPAIKIEGLMTMTPFSAGPEAWRECFLGLKTLRGDLESEFGVTLPELSMGTSQDWQEAVKCGATMIRLGQAVFGSREDLHDLEKTSS